MNYLALLSCVCAHAMLNTGPDEQLEQTPSELIKVGLSGLSGSKGAVEVPKDITVKDLISIIVKETGFEPTDLLFGTEKLPPEAILGDIAQGKSEIDLQGLVLFGIEKLNQVLEEKQSEIKALCPNLVGVEARIYDENSGISVIEIIKKVVTRDLAHIFSYSLEINYKKCSDEMRNRALDALALSIRDFDNKNKYAIKSGENIGKYVYNFEYARCGPEMGLYIGCGDAEESQIFVLSGTNRDSFFNYVATVGVKAILGVLEPGYGSNSSPSKPLLPQIASTDILEQI